MIYSGKELLVLDVGRCGTTFLVHSVTHSLVCPASCELAHFYGLTSYSNAEENPSKYLIPIQQWALKHTYTFPLNYHQILSMWRWKYALFTFFIPLNRFTLINMYYNIVEINSPCQVGRIFPIQNTAVYPASSSSNPRKIYVLSMWILSSDSYCNKYKS